MAARATDYDSWSLQELRDEATRRRIYFPRKDGVKTLASKLRTFDRSGQSSGDAGENENLAESAPDTSLSFEQRLQLQEREMQMLELRRKISQEQREIRELEREEERERRQAEREAEKERREYERQKSQEEEERSIREEERLRLLRAEKEQFAARESERRQVSNNETRGPKFLRESEDMDDYLRIFEMTTRAQSLPEGDWVSNLVPKLTEKAKSIYLEIPDPACQDYFESKAIIIKAYQLTADHCRYRFQTSEKNLFSVETGPVRTSIVGWPLPRLQGMQKRSSNK